MLHTSSEILIVNNEVIVVKITPNQKDLEELFEITPTKKEKDNPTIIAIITAILNNLNNYEEEKGDDSSAPN